MGRARTVIGYALIGFGAFAVALGLLLRFFVYPHVAKLPLDVDTVSVAQGHDVTAVVIDTVDGAPSPEIRHGLNVTSTTHVTGDLTRPEVTEDGDVAVWVEATRTVDDTSGILINASVRSLCLDRHTGAAVAPCSGQYIAERQGEKTTADPKTVQQPGLSFKFPFDTEEHSYPLFDLTLKHTVQARFENEETVHGVDTYRFVARTEPTKVGEQDVPGSLIGSDAGSVRVDQYYSDQRTMWVEPDTGVLIDVVDRSKTEMVAPGQVPGDGVAVYDGTMRLSDQSVEDNLREAGLGTGRIELLTFWPIVMWIGGLVVVAAGVLLLTVRRNRTTAGTGVRESAGG